MVLAGTVSSPAMAQAVRPSLVEPNQAPSIRKPDRRGISALLSAAEVYTRKGDADAIADLMDFPVQIVSDRGDGTTTSMAWTKEQWLREMRPKLVALPKGIRWQRAAKVTFVSDVLAVVDETHSLVVGRKRQSWKSAAFVVNSGGKWLFKSMMEGLWLPDAPDQASAVRQRTP